MFAARQFCLLLKLQLTTIPRLKKGGVDAIEVRNSRRGGCLPAGQVGKPLPKNACIKNNKSPSLQLRCSTPPAMLRDRLFSSEKGEEPSPCENQLQN